MSGQSQGIENNRCPSMMRKPLDGLMGQFFVALDGEPRLAQSELYVKRCCATDWQLKGKCLIHKFWCKCQPSYVVVMAMKWGSFLIMLI